MFASYNFFDTNRGDVLFNAAVLSYMQQSAPAPVYATSGNFTTTLSVTGAVTFASTLGVTGALTATGGVDGVLGGVTPAAAAVTTLAASGIATMSGLVRWASISAAVSAAGTTRADATALTAQTNVLTTVTSNTGVILPASAVGNIITIFNNGANPVKVYAAGSDTIDGTAGSTGVTLTNALRCQFFCVAANTYISAKLGATST